jgi:hypothetical protein
LSHPASGVDPSGKAIVLAVWTTYIQ